MAQTNTKHNNAHDNDVADEADMPASSALIYTDDEPADFDDGPLPTIDAANLVAPAFVPSTAAERSAGRPGKTGAYDSALEEHARTNEKYAQTTRSRRNRNLAGALVALLVIVGAIGVGLGYNHYMNSIGGRLGFGSAEEDAAIRSALTPTVSDEPFYMMVIGSDDRDGVEGRRSDTNIVARVDAKNGLITLISIPRDTAINLEKYGVQKFNAAYNFGGAPGAIKAAEMLLGIKISHYAEVDFGSLISLVDAVGGVTVDVPLDIDDIDAGNVALSAGVQELNGEAALVFARSRSYATGDYQRTANQRLLVQALVSKIMELPATQLPGVINAAADCVSTDLSVSELMDYAQAFKALDGVTMYSVMVPSTDVMQDGIAYVVCDVNKLRIVMNAVRAGRDPSVYFDDLTVSSSAEAQKKGAESYPVYVSDDPEIGEDLSQYGFVFTDDDAYVYQPQADFYNYGTTTPGYGGGQGTGVIDPGYTDLGTQDLGTQDPGYVDSGVVDPGYTDPGYTDPGYVDLGYTDPGYTDPGYVDPGYVDPGYVDPGYTDPGYVDPGYTDPGYVDPGYGYTGDTGYGDSGMATYEYAGE